MRWVRLVGLVAILAGCSAPWVPTPPALAVAPTVERVFPTPAAIGAPPTAPSSPPTATATAAPTRTPLPAPTATIPPTATVTPRPPTATAPPLPPTNTPVPAYRSGGLGWTRVDWEQAHGKGIDGTAVHYEGGKYLVVFYPDTSPAGIVALIVRQDTAGQYPGLQTARLEGLGLLPADAAFVRTDVVDGDRYDVYTSASFAGRFAPATVAGLAWHEDTPGQFSIGYRMTGGPVLALYVGARGTP